MLTLYLWAILSLPARDIWLCDLWTRELTREGMLAACGTTALDPYIVQVYDLDMHKQCETSAIDLPTLAQACRLTAPLDQYVIRLIQPVATQQSSLLCYVTSETPSQPARDEIIAQCPEAMWARYEIQTAGILPQKEEKQFTCPARDLQTGFGLYDQAPSASAIATDKPLHMLAGKLIWHGIAKPVCDGNSGLDPYTLAANACGLSTTRADVYRWQNQFDAEIYAAALQYNVPAALIKRMMSVESQFWLWWETPAGETGLMQITDNGIDTLMRFDPAQPVIDPFYWQRDDLGKFYARAWVRDMLTCHACKMEDLIAHIKKNIPLYARTLAAFHCRAVTLNPALTGHDQWRQAVVDYNGSAEYLAKIESGE